MTPMTPWKVGEREHTQMHTYTHSHTPFPTSSVPVQSRRCACTAPTRTLKHPTHTHRYEPDASTRPSQSSKSYKYRSLYVCILKGADKQLVGQVAADIRSYRKPEPYKGKGIRYSDEHVRRKEAKKK